MKIHIKSILSESFVDYKKCSMLICGCTCTFKCGKELCQNSQLAKSQTKEIDVEKIVEEYMKNDLTSAIVFRRVRMVRSIFRTIGMYRSIQRENER